MAGKRRYGIGLQWFPNMVEKQTIYEDKTAYVYRLAVEQLEKEDSPGGRIMMTTAFRSKARYACRQLILPPFGTEEPTVLLCPFCYISNSLTQTKQNTYEKTFKNSTPVAAAVR